MGEIDSAREHYDEAIELYRQERSNLGLANALQWLGDLEREQANLDEARELYLKARELYISERESMGLGYTCSELARVYHAQGDADGCGRFLEEATQAAEASNTPGVVQYVLDVKREVL